jgi:lipopolysaccharide export system permease protein
MTRFSSYLAGQVVRPMIAIVLIALAALLAERMLRILDIVVGWRGSLVVLLEMLSYLIPHYMSLALPAAFFIAILLTLSRLGRDGELDAMRAAGVGLWQAARPLFVLALVICAINAVILSHLQPYSRYAYRSAVFALSNVSFQALLRERVFVTLERTTYSVERLSDDRNEVGGLFLYNREAADGALTITAREGRIIPPQGDLPLTFELVDGIHQWVPAAGEQAAPGTALPQAATIRFRNFRSDLKGAEPRPFRPRGEDERELTVPELWRALGGPLPGIDAEEIAAEFHGRLVRILATVVLPLVAVPLAIARRRATRSYGIVIGLILLLAFNQIVNFGESLADNGKISPYLGLWGPFLAFAALGLVLFRRRDRQVPSGRTPVSDMIDAAIERIAAWRGRGTVSP